MNYLEQNKEVTLNALVEKIEDKVAAKKCLSYLMDISPLGLNKIVLPIATLLLQQDCDFDMEDLVDYCNDRLDVINELTQCNTAGIDYLSEYMVGMAACFGNIEGINEIQDP